MHLNLQSLPPRVAAWVQWQRILSYAHDTAAKFAQRGLADTLRLEALRYSNRKAAYSVQCIFAHNFVTDTFLEEQKLKPALTKRIEGTDGDLSTKTGKFCSSHLFSHKADLTLPFRPISIRCRHRCGDARCRSKGRLRSDRWEARAASLLGYFHRNQPEEGMGNMGFAARSADVVGVPVHEESNRERVYR